MFAVQVMLLSKVISACISFLTAAEGVCIGNLMNERQIWQENEDQDKSEVGFYFPGHSYRTLVAHSVFQCSASCLRESRCKSYNYHFERRKCELNDQDRSSYFYQQQTWILVDRVWVEQVRGLVAKEGARYYSRLAIGLSSQKDSPCSLYRCAEDEICTPSLPAWRMLYKHTCQRTVFRIEDFFAWSSWTSWSDCSTSCGGGVETRTRHCAGAKHQSLCRGTSQQVRKCYTNEFCPQWSQWMEWSSCESLKDCGEGVRTRTRTCKFSIGDQSCVGESSDSQPCFSPSCDSPIQLARGTSGAVFIYDDSTLYNPKWRGVCQSNLSSAEDIVSVKRTVCRYFNLYLLSSEEEEKSMNEAYFHPISCNADERFLMKCEHEPWGYIPRCSKRLQVNCTDDRTPRHYYRLPEETSWSICAQLCHQHHLQICAYGDIFPFGNSTPFNSMTFSGDQWAPIRESYNEWTQVGDSRGRTGWRHNEIYGPPPWGYDLSSDFQGKGHIFCCVVE